MLPINAILFDLDGTLLDTAPDLVTAFNRLRVEHALPVVSLTAFRSIVSLGSKFMVKRALGIDETHPNFDQLRSRFLDLYQQHIADATTLFPHMDSVLNDLEQKKIPWGIVTNKLTRHVTKLLKILQLDQRPACVICGDSLPQYKPDPTPILYACHLLKQDPTHCIYVGDSIVDVTASKAAGMRSLVALYGYISDNDDPFSWDADGYICDPREILKYF